LNEKNRNGSINPMYMISEQERASIKAGVCTTKEDSLVPNPPGIAPVTCEVFDRAVQPCLDLWSLRWKVELP
jgi:hypothetical protein